MFRIHKSNNDLQKTGYPDMDSNHLIIGSIEKLMK